MRDYLPYYRPVFDAGDDPQGATACAADVDVEYDFNRCTHVIDIWRLTSNGPSLSLFTRRVFLTSLCGCYQNLRCAVRGKHAIKADELYPRLRSRAARQQIGLSG